MYGYFKCNELKKKDILLSTLDRAKSAQCQSETGFRMARFRTARNTYLLDINAHSYFLNNQFKGDYTLLLSNFVLVLVITFKRIH